MVPERRLYPWDTVVLCGSKLARTPVSRTVWTNLVYAAARRSENLSTKTTVHKCVPVGKPIRNGLLQ